jgi:hypothetical protein
VEQVLVFAVKAVPDRVLADLAGELARRGFRLGAASTYDVGASRGLDRVFVSAAPHPRGVALRVKAKSLVPGRSARLLDEVTHLLVVRLGAPAARTEFPQEVVP